MIESTPEPLSMVPLKIEGVVVGLVSVGPNNELSVKCTNASTESYLKELILSDMTESISLIVDYSGERHTYVPDPGELGHIRLI